MKCEIDEMKYDEIQMEMLYFITESIKDKLVEAGIAGESLEKLTTNIAFSMAEIIDGSAIMETQNKKPIIPVLTFANDENFNSGICSEGSSWMHEYVHGVVEDVFGKE